MIRRFFAKPTMKLPVEDRACITGAVAKLPQVAALKIEGSRAIEGRTLEQAQSKDGANGACTASRWKSMSA